MIPLTQIVKSVASRALATSAGYSLTEISKSSHRNNAYKDQHAMDYFFLLMSKCNSVKTLRIVRICYLHYLIEKQEVHFVGYSFYPSIRHREHNDTSSSDDIAGKHYTFFYNDDGTPYFVKLESLEPKNVSVSRAHLRFSLFSGTSATSGSTISASGFSGATSFPEPCRIFHNQSGTFFRLWAFPAT